MHTEIATACDFVSGMLQSEDPASRQRFKERLERLLRTRFAAHTWDPARPNVGSGLRCIQCLPGRVDPIILEAASGTVSGVRSLPSFSLWTDPGEVACRYGLDGSIFNLSLKNPGARNCAPDAGAPSMLAHPGQEVLVR
eukprot:m.285226 g.285226  ORF g.285226 m.285226 type:complete len:139 (-) comp11328_c0_seq1:1549-1965(-)